MKKTNIRDYFPKDYADSRARFLKEVGQMPEGNIQIVILAVIIGTLSAIVYSLRILVLMERRIARIDENLFAITKRIALEEIKIEKEEKKIESAISRRRR